MTTSESTGVSGSSTEDAEDVAKRFDRAFPGTVVWFGRQTRHWWAVAWLAGDWRLIEAPTPDGLLHVLIHRRYPAAIDPKTGSWRNSP